MFGALFFYISPKYLVNFGIAKPLSLFFIKVFVSQHIECFFA